MSWQSEAQPRPDLHEGDNELRLIPIWAIALSVVVFAAVQFLFQRVIPTPHHGSPIFHVIMSYSWGTALSSYMLLIGYISRDVKRRNMSAGIWMLIVLVMPGGIGAIVYFLLRQPIMSRCPSCRTEVANGFHFCPQCQFQMSPVCCQCFRGVHITSKSRSSSK